MVPAMRALWFPCTLSLLLVGSACERRRSGAEMPAANDWQGSLGPDDDPHAGVMTPGPSAADPHAGLDMGGAGGDPHAGLDIGGAGGDPHAGLDIGGAGGDPHAAPAAPDPQTAVSGAVAVAPALASTLPAGGVLFMSVRPAGADGQPAGMPMAVEVYPQASFPQAFTLSGGNQMVAGAGTMGGEVVIMARWDQDGDAGTKQPGDVTGMTRARVPATGLSIILDTVLP